MSNTFAILRVAACLFATIPYCGSARSGDLVVDRTIPSGDRLVVFKSVRTLAAASKETRLLMDDWANEWMHGLTNKPMTPSNDFPYIELTVAVISKSGITNSLNWKRGYFAMNKRPPGMTNYLDAFDVGMAGDRAFTCYKVGTRLFVEELPYPSTNRNRICVELASDQSLNFYLAYTNASFHTDSNGIVSLKAQGTDGVEIVWKYLTEEWQYTPDLSKPGKATGELRQTQYVYEGDHWVEKK